MKSPFKVMSTAALAAAVAVPTLSVPAADAAETSSFHSVALETEDGSVKTVPFTEYAKAKTFGTGELGEFVAENDVVAVSAEEGTFVSVRTLALAKIESPDADTAALLADLDDSEDNQVAEEDVAEYTEFGEPEVVAPAVESVSAINLKQVEVKLSGEFDADAAKSGENYTLEDTDGNTYTIEDVALDGETVTLSVEGNIDNQTDATLTVGEEVTGEEASEDISFFDTVPPEVTNSEVIGSSTVKLSFSEPLDVEKTDSGKWITGAGDDAKDAFEVTQDGDKLFIKSVEFVKNNTEANVEVYSTFDEGTVDLSVDKMLEDYAALSVLSQTFELDVVEDTEAPEVVDYKNATQQSVTLVFNEDIELTDDADFGNFYHTNSNNTVDEDISGDDDPSQIGAEVNGNELTLTFEDNELPQGTAYVYVDGESVMDKWGNVAENQIRQDVEVTVDAEAPTVENVESKNETTLDVTFSENLDADTVSADNFTILDANGDEVDVVDEAELDGDVATLTFDTKLGGEYAVLVEGVEDKAGNEIDEVTKGFTVNDATSVDTDDINAKVYGIDNDADVWTLVVNYPEQMALEGSNAVNDLQKYELASTLLNKSDVEASLSVIDNGTAVEITIPKDNEEGLDLDNLYDATNEQTLTIGRVEDVSGNATDEFNFDVTAQEAGHVSIDDAYATETDEVVVEFGDRLDLDVDDLQLYVDDNDDQSYVEADDTEIDPSEVSVDLVDGKSVATISISSEIGYNAEDVHLAVVGESSENRFGDTLEKDTSVAVDDEINPVLTSDDSGYTGVDVNENDDVTLTFEETVGFSVNGDLAASDLVISDDDGELVAGSEYTLEDDTTDETVRVVLSGDYAGTLDISTVDSPKYIQDTEGNTIASFEDVEVDVDYDTVAPTATIDEDATNSASEFTVNFDESVDVSGDETATDVESHTFTSSDQTDITFTATDDNGNSEQYTASYDGTTWSLTETPSDGTAPDAPSVAGQSAGLTDDTLNASEVSSDQTVRVSLAGTGDAAVADDTVNVLINGTQVAQTTLTSGDISNGHVDVTVASADLSGLSDTTHDFTATVTDQAGNTSTASTAYVVTVDTTINAATSVTGTDNDGTTGADDRDFTVDWTVSNDSDIASQEVYVVPKGTTLATSSHTALATFNDNTTATWTGSGDTTDSTGATITGGDYDAYVVVTDDAGNTAVSSVDTFTVTSD